MDEAQPPTKGKLIHDCTIGLKGVNSAMHLALKNPIFTEGLKVTAETCSEVLLSSLVR